MLDALHAHHDLHHHGHHGHFHIGTSPIICFSSRLSSDLLHVSFGKILSRMWMLYCTLTPWPETYASSPPIHAIRTHDGHYLGINHHGNLYISHAHHDQDTYVLLTPNTLLLCNISALALRSSLSFRAGGSLSNCTLSTATGSPTAELITRSISVRLALPSSRDHPLTCHTQRCMAAACALRTPSRTTSSGPRWPCKGAES